MSAAPQEILVVYWEWTEETKYNGSRFWGAHSVENDGRIADWPKMGMRPIGAAKVIVQEGGGLHLLDGSSPPPAPNALPIELDGVADQVSEGDGFWKSCSGCHELNEGVPTGPYSEIMNCNLGMGCRECGGIGAIWDGTDYSIFGVEPEPVDLTELPDDVRQAAIIAFNTAADVPQWGGGEPYLIIGRAIIAGRTPPAENALAPVTAGQGVEGLLTEALRALDHYADPTGYTDSNGDQMPADAVLHEGLLAKDTAAKIRSALAQQPLSVDAKERNE